MTFIGFDNFEKLFVRDRFFWPIVGQTIEYAALQILFQVGGGLILAVFLTNLTHGRTIFQTIYYAPVVVSSVAICQIFEKLFSVTPTGVVNHVLALIDQDLILMEWLTTPGLSLVVAAFVEGYKTMGIYMVIFFAALISVPPDLTEAACIDGASGLQTLLLVKLPYIRHVIVANVVLVLNNSLRSFDIPFLLTAGGPGTTSELMSSYMYKQAFNSMQYGYGSAISVFIVGFCLFLALFTMKYFNEN